MGQLRHFVMTNVAFIGMLLFCARVAEATGQDAITSMPSNALDTEIHSIYYIFFSFYNIRKEFS